jgi:hypothetical protein
MKRIVSIAIVTVMLLGMLSTVEAQGREMRKGVMRQGKREMVSPEKRAEFMAKQLELSDVEKLKLQVLFEKQEAKAIKHREEMKKMREERHLKMIAERKSNQAELIKIIGNEKFQELQSKRIARLEHQNRKLKINSNKHFRRDHRMMNQRKQAN